jgi:argonaute-like protein implicated in RNA metabolism and viral defense
VALVKVLLTNQRWPFVLETPLHAAVTIGLDIKHNAAGFLVVADHGKGIRFELRTSQQRERLLAGQVAKYLSQILRPLSAKGPVDSIVLHRDGRVFASEVAGFRAALASLKRDGVVTKDCRTAILEVSKSGPVPLRAYHVPASAGSVSNPEIGSVIWGEREAYICTTGWPLLQLGTANPLHVRIAEGDLPLEDCLQDLYSLSALTWTKPDGCTRNPITVSLNDRLLFDRAGTFDEDAVEFADSGDEGRGSDEEVA